MHPLVTLADEVSQLGRRLEQISAELRTYQPEELTRPIAAPQVQAPAPMPQPPMPQALMPPPPVYPVYPAYPQPVARQPKPSLFESLSKDGAGSRVLAWVGGAVTLLGVVFFLVLAIQRGWLGPLSRVLVGAALGCALIGIGLRVHKAPTGRVGAYALAATGIAALYLDAIAATTLYEYLPTFGGLGAALLVAVAGLLLGMRWDSMGLAIAVVIGCVVCAPMITSGFQPELVAFLLVLQVATLPVQLRKDWPAMALIAGIAPLVASVLTTTVIFKDHGPDMILNAVIALLALVVAVAAALVTVNRQPANDAGTVLMSLSAAPALFSTITLTKTPAVVVSSVVAAVLLVVWLTSKYWPRTITMIAAAGCLVAVFQATCIAFDGTARSTVLMGQAALLALVGLGLRNPVAWWGSLGFGVVGAIMAMADDAPPRLLLDETFQSTSGTLAGALLTSLLILMLSVLLPWVAVSMGILKPAQRSVGPWIAFGATALYGAAGIVLSGALLISPDRGGFLLGHVVITVSWTVAALVLLLRGIAVRAMRLIGLVLVGASLVKLVLFDLSALDGMARVAAFLGAGLILLAAGTRYAKLVANTQQ